VNFTLLLLLSGIVSALLLYWLWRFFLIVKMNFSYRRKLRRIRQQLEQAQDAGQLKSTFDAFMSIYPVNANVPMEVQLNQVASHFTDAESLQELVKQLSRILYRGAESREEEVLQLKKQFAKTLAGQKRLIYSFIQY
jgi:hypothetical protein